MNVNAVAFDKKDKLNIALVALLCFMFVDFVLFKWSFSLGFTITYAFLFVVTSVYLVGKKQKPSAIGCVYGTLSIASSIPPTLYNDTISSTLMPLITAGLYVLYCISYTSASTVFGSYKTLVEACKTLFVKPFVFMPSVAASAKISGKKGKKPFSGLIGIIASLPVLCVVVPLLVESDAAFEGLVNDALSKINSFFGEFVVIIILLPYCYSYLYSIRHGESFVKPHIKSNRKSLSVIVCTSFMFVISATYILYLFSQLAYFFSAFSYILPKDYENTASEFARRGFYEMCFVCIINIAVVSMVCAFAKQGKNSKLLKALCVFVSAFSALLVVVAMQKMAMNISVYALSKNRILVFAFMLTMLVTIVMLVVHIFAPKVPYMQAIIIFFSVLLIAVSYSNIDARIADYNIKAYNNHKIESLDVNSIANLSDSAVPYLISLAENSNEEAQNALYSVVGNNYRDELVLTLKTMGIKSSGDIRRFNYSHALAANAIYDYYLSLDETDAKVFANRSALADYEKYYCVCVDEKESYYMMTDDSYSETVYRLNKATNLYEKQ